LDELLALDENSTSVVVDRWVVEIGEKILEETNDETVR